MHPTKIKDSEFYAIMLPKGMPIAKKMLFPKNDVTLAKCGVSLLNKSQFDEYNIVGTIEQYEETIVVLDKVANGEISAAIVPFIEK